MPFELHLEEKEIPRFEVSGELSFEEFQPLSQAIWEARVRNGYTRGVLDLRGVTSFDLTAQQQETIAHVGSMTASVVGAVAEVHPMQLAIVVSQPEHAETIQKAWQVQAAVRPHPTMTYNAFLTVEEAMEWLGA